MSLTGIFKAIINAIISSIAGPLIVQVRTEWAVAKVELQVKLRELRTGVIMLVVAVTFGFFVVALLLFAAVFGLATIMPAWAAALVIAAILGAWVITFGIWGARKISRNTDLIPHRAIDNIKDALP